MTVRSRGDGDRVDPHPRAYAAACSPARTAPTRRRAPGRRPQRRLRRPSPSCPGTGTGRRSGSPSRRSAGPGEGSAKLARPRSSGAGNARAMVTASDRLSAAAGWRWTGAGNRRLMPPLPNPAVTPSTTRFEVGRRTARASPECRQDRDEPATAIATTTIAPVARGVEGRETHGIQPGHGGDDRPADTRIAWPEVCAAMVTASVVAPWRVPRAAPEIEEGVVDADRHPHEDDHGVDGRFCVDEVRDRRRQAHGRGDAGAGEQDRNAGGDERTGTRGRMSTR